jgi:hypothetical protein
MAQARSPCGGGHALGASDPPRLHRVLLEAGFTEVRVRPRPRSTTSSKHAEFCPWGETHGGSLGSEGRLDDTLDGVTEIRTKRAVLQDGVDEQPGSD